MELRPQSFPSVDGSPRRGCGPRARPRIRHARGWRLRHVRLRERSTPVAVWKSSRPSGSRPDRAVAQCRVDIQSPWIPAVRGRNDCPDVRAGLPLLMRCSPGRWAPAARSWGLCMRSAPRHPRVRIGGTHLKSGHGAMASVPHHDQTHGSVQVTSVDGRRTGRSVLDGGAADAFRWPSGRGAACAVPATGLAVSSGRILRRRDLSAVAVCVRCLKACAQSMAIGVSGLHSPACHV